MSFRVCQQLELLGETPETIQDLLQSEYSLRDQITDASAEAFALEAKTKLAFDRTATDIEKYHGLARRIIRNGIRRISDLEGIDTKYQTECGPVGHGQRVHRAERRITQRYNHNRGQQIICCPLHFKMKPKTIANLAHRTASRREKGGKSFWVVQKSRASILPEKTSSL